MADQDPFTLEQALLDQSWLLGLVIGLLVSKNIVTTDELIHHIQTSYPQQPEQQRRLLKLVESALSTQR